MATIDRILQIHQSYTQEKISALNNELLKAQLAQSEQLNEIDKQLEVANSLNRRLIELQKQEIQQRETQKFYKHLSFQINEMIKFIDNQNNIDIKCFLINAFSLFITSSLNSSIEILSEINDKSYCKELLNKFLELKMSSFSENIQFEDSLFSELIENEKEYEKSKEDNTYKIIQLQNRIQGSQSEELKIKKVTSKKTLIILSIITILTLFAFPFNLFLIPFTLVSYIRQRKWRQNYRIQLAHRNKIRDSKIGSNDSISKEIEILENQINNHKFIQIKESLTNKYPDWENILEETERFIPTLKQDSQKRKDSLIEEAAKILIASNVGSTSLVARKLSIGLKRAEKIMDQLEELKIVGKSNGISNRELLVKNEEQLDKIFTLINSKK